MSKIKVEKCKDWEGMQSFYVNAKCAKIIQHEQKKVEDVGGKFNFSHYLRNLIIEKHTSEES